MLNFKNSQIYFVFLIQNFQNWYKKKKIKIGFLSQISIIHSITYFIRSYYGFKTTKFETFGLSLTTNQHDETTDKFSNLFDNWVDLGDKSDQEIVCNSRWKYRHSNRSCWFMVL